MLSFLKPLSEFKFFKFLVVGGVCFVFELYLFYFFIDSFTIVFANVTSRIIALLFHFLLIKYFVFFHTKKPFLTLFYYAVLSIFNSVLSGALIYLFSKFVFDFNLVIYKILFDIILININFFILRVYVFK